MSDLEVRQLRYFVAIAEELHFGRAAARLGMAQPPLSRAIRELERQLGVGLLTRTTRQVALTPAGQVLLREARTALEAVTAAARRTQHAGQPTPSLRVALKADFDAGLLPAIIAAFGREDASLPVELAMGGQYEQLPAVREGRADVAILPGPVDDQSLDSEPLLTEARVVALAATDPLAARDSLCLADLAGRTLPSGRRLNRDGTTAEGSSEPPRVTGLDQIFNLIELGGMIIFLPVSVARRYTRPAIAYRPVEDLDAGTLVVAWPRASRSPAVAAFVRAAISVAVTAAAAARPDDALHQELANSGLI